VTTGQPGWPWQESGNSHPIRFRASGCTKPYQTPPLLYGLMISDRTWRMFPLQLTRQYFATALQLHWRQQSEKYGVVCWGKNTIRGIELLWLTTLLRGMGRGRSIHLCATLVAETVYTQYQGTGGVFGCLNIQMHRSLKAGSIREIKFGDFLLPSHWIMTIFVLPIRCHNGRCNFYSHISPSVSASYYRNLRIHKQCVMFQSLLAPVEDAGDAFFHF